MSPHPLQLCLTLRDGSLQPGARLSGQRIHEMFEHADRLVANACREPVVLVDSRSGKPSPIKFQDVVKVSYEPREDGVRVTIAMAPAHLPWVKEQAAIGMEQVKRLWPNRIRIALARIIGIDIREIDSRNLEKFQEQAAVVLSRVMIDCLGSRLEQAVSQKPQDTEPH